MTDNFDHYKKLITINGGLPKTNKKGNLDLFYVIELIRRGKDNPDMPAANYHFKSYHIFSWADYEKYEQEIKDICTLLHCRAYASVNYKLMSQIALDTIAEETRRIAAHDYKRFNHIFESCCGKFVDKGNNLWIVDFDNMKAKDISEELVNLIDKAWSEYESNLLYIMPTKSGFHFITHPFNRMYFEAEYKRRIGGEMPDIKQNHVTLLYENL